MGKFSLNLKTDQLLHLAERQQFELLADIGMSNGDIKQIQVQRVEVDTIVGREVQLLSNGTVQRVPEAFQLSFLYVALRHIATLRYYPVTDGRISEELMKTI